MYLLILTLFNQAIAMLNFQSSNLLVFGFNEFISGLCLGGLIVRLTDHKK